MTFSPCDLNYQQQLDDKTSRLIELMADFNPPKPLIFASPQQHYRMRAEFRIWHDGDDIDHIMYDKQTKAPIKITQFPVASLLINQAMQAIIPLLKFNHSLRYKLFQIDYLSTLSGELLISLIYHRQLDEDWTNQATQLKQALINQGLNVQIVGRASKQKICLDRDYVDEKLTVLGREYHYRQVENSFTQPNANINIEMLSWAINQTKNMTGDLLELYCGNGNFSIALAQNFNQVLATEISKASVSTAQHNIKTNQIDNLKIMRLSAEEFTQAINGVRTFNRLQGIDLSTYQCETVLVDPPRSGLDMATLEMIAHYRNIIYISCNPNTLKQNLEYLTKTHQIKQMALFDQFPYTEHIEVGMVLSNDSK